MTNEIRQKGVEKTARNPIKIVPQSYGVEYNKIKEVNLWRSTT